MNVSDIRKSDPTRRRFFVNPSCRAATQPVHRAALNLLHTGLLTGEDRDLQPGSCFPTADRSSAPAHLMFTWVCMFVCECVFVYINPGVCASHVHVYALSSSPFRTETCWEGLSEQHAHMHIDTNPCDSLHCSELHTWTYWRSTEQNLCHWENRQSGTTDLRGTVKRALMTCHVFSRCPAHHICWA